MSSSNEFIGLQMIVTLRSPAERLRGSISGVEAGKSLTLSNGLSLFFCSWFLCRTKH